LIMLAVVSTHLAFIQVQGMAPGMAHQRPDRPGLKFFPDFLVRDLLLWLVCLIVLRILVYLLPYGPGIPGMEWELGKKANPLAPPARVTKRGWSSLGFSRPLKDFPPHLLGMEGPQAALLVVTMLMGIWALVPWLDRRASKSRPSPMFTDLAIAAVIF